MLCIYHWNFGFCINTYQALSIVCSRVLWAGILHLAQPLSWADTLSGFFELSWAEPAQGVLSQIEPAWAGSTQLKDWASLSWKDLELSNWARLSWSCFSLSQLELDQYFIFSKSSFGAPALYLTQGTFPVKSSAVGKEKSEPERVRRILPC